MSEWISVKDRLPSKEESDDNFGWFIVYRMDCKRADVSRYDKHSGCYSYEHGWKYSWDGSITHWMPLPKPPENLQEKALNNLIEQAQGLNMGY